MSGGDPHIFSGCQSHLRRTLGANHSPYRRRTAWCVSYRAARRPVRCLRVEQVPRGFFGIEIASPDPRGLSSDLRGCLERLVQDVDWCPTK